MAGDWQRMCVRESFFRKKIHSFCCIFFTSFTNFTGSQSSCTQFIRKYLVNIFLVQNYRQVSGYFTTSAETKYIKQINIYRQSYLCILLTSYTKKSMLGSFGIEWYTVQFCSIWYVLNIKYCVMKINECFIAWNCHVKTPLLVV